jgi:hypothetical protein
MSRNHLALFALFLVAIGIVVCFVVSSASVKAATYTVVLQAESIPMLAPEGILVAQTSVNVHRNCSVLNGVDSFFIEKGLCMDKRSSTRSSWKQDNTARGGYLGSSVIGDKFTALFNWIVKDLPSVVKRRSFSGIGNGDADHERLVYLHVNFGILHSYPSTLIHPHLLRSCLNGRLSGLGGLTLIRGLLFHLNQSVSRGLIGGTSHPIYIADGLPSLVGSGGPTPLHFYESFLHYSQLAASDNYIYYCRCHDDKREKSVQLIKCGDHVPKLNPMFFNRIYYLAGLCIGLLLLLLGVGAVGFWFIHISSNGKELLVGGIVLLALSI